MLRSVVNSAWPPRSRGARALPGASPSNSLLSRWGSCTQNAYRVYRTLKRFASFARYFTFLPVWCDVEITLERIHRIAPCCPQQTERFTRAFDSIVSDPDLDDGGHRLPLERIALGPVSVIMQIVLVWLAFNELIASYWTEACDLLVDASLSADVRGVP